MANRTELIDLQAATRNSRRARAAATAALLSVWLVALVSLSGPGILSWMTGRLPMLLLPALTLLAICLLPGLALLRWLWGEDYLAWPDRLAIAGGIGAGMPALLLMALHLLRLPWGPWQTVVYLSLAAVALAIPRRATASLERQHTRPTEDEIAATPQHWVGVALIGMSIVGLIGRLFTIRDQVVGANADSYHHSVVAQLLVERGGLFTDWLPYAPLTTFTYHYGFHALVAFVHWLTGMPVAGLLPIVGQLLGAAIIPAIYTLTTRLSGLPLAGIGAALLVGFFNTQPAYYAFWGRYPFITSHLLLIAILCCWQRVIATPRLRPGLLVLTALACAALAHTHYQTTIFVALFVVIMLMARLVRAATLREAGVLLGRAALIGGLALLLALPWLANTIGGNLDRNVAFNSEQQSGQAFAGVALPALVPLYLKGPVLVFAMAGFLLALRHNQRQVLLLAGWALLSQLTVVPYLFGLPGTGAIESSLAPMTLYLTLGPLAGYALAVAIDGLKSAIARMRDRWAERAAQGLTMVGLLMVIVISAWGLGWQRDLVPLYARMVTPADTRAIAWVRDNTPPDARFLINSNPLYGGLMLVGTDGGLWLPLLANRATTVPPLAYGSELASDPKFAARTQALAEALRAARLTDTRPRAINVARAGAVRALRAAGVSYIYLGAQPLRGPGTFPEVDRIDPGVLRASPEFRVVYDSDGVVIFELVQH